MGKCGRRVKKVGRVVAKTLTPVGVRMIGAIVGEIAGADLTNAQKRAAALAASKVALKTAGIDAREHMIRLTQEYAVAALNQGAAALEDLGAVEDRDLTPADDEPDD